MDGTLHPIRQESFLDSPVHNQMVERSIVYVMQKLGIGKRKATELFEGIMERYPRFYSLGLQKEQGIDRWDYLVHSWNINPEGIIQRVDGLDRMLNDLTKRNDLYVVSDAPRVWMGNVMSHLGIRDFFSGLYSGTNLNLKKKQGLFPHILSDIGAEPSQCYMVGDEEQNDIIPARAIGINTVYLGKSDSAVADYSIRDVLSLRRIIVDD